VAVTHPTFNLPLAGAIPPPTRKIMIGPPEIWAWQVAALGRAVAALLTALPGVRDHPTHALKAACVAAERGRLALGNFDELLCVTPMNAAAYGRLRERTGGGAAVLQARHPAADLARDEALAGRAAALRRRLGIEPDRHLVSIFPGSREGEIRLLLPRILRAADIIRARRDVAFAVSVSDGRFDALAAALIGGGAGRADVLRTTAPAADLLAASSHAILCSGTITLEAACLAVPATVANTLRPGTRFLLRPLYHRRRIGWRYAPWGLPNAILASRGTPRAHLPYRECVLTRFRAGAIAASVLAGLPDGPYDAARPPLLPAETVRRVREAIAPPGALAPHEYVARTVGELA
jgi:hypothetical protein